MAKMFAKTAILMPDGSMVARRTVFDATPAQAKQFDALNVARQALPSEIEAAGRAQAIAEGREYDEPKGK